MIDNKTLLRNHDGKLKQLLKIYNVKGDLYKGKLLRYSVGIDLLVTVIVCLISSDVYSIIVSFLNFYVDSLPSLLGFNLGAYALLIGLGSSHLIEKLTANFKNKFTTFQRASSVFGFCVLLQVVAFIVAFGYKAIIIIEEGSTVNIPAIFYSPYVTEPTNVVGLFILNFFGIYSILILLSVIESIFAISQASHFYAVSKQLKNEKEANALNVKFTSFLVDHVVIASNSEINGVFQKWGTSPFLSNGGLTSQTVAIVKVDNKIYQVLPTSIVFTEPSS